KVEVRLGGPHGLGRKSLLGRLVVHLAPAHAVRVRHTGNRALGAYRLISELDVPANSFDGLLFRRAVGMTVDEDRVARRAAKELIHARIQSLPADVPKRLIGPCAR